MPTMPEVPSLALAWKPWLVGCMVHSPLSPHLPSIRLQLEGHAVQTLLGSGNNITLAQPSILPNASGPRNSLNVTWGRTRGGHRQLVKKGELVRMIGAVPDLPVPLLLSWDWPGFPL